jgi:hypothetical protein
MRERQRDIVFELWKHTNLDIVYLFGRKHMSSKPGVTCFWDAIETMRYCIELYDARPQLFPKLSQERFEQLRDEFYRNQPVILTLPLKA